MAPPKAAPPAATPPARGVDLAVAVVEGAFREVVVEVLPETGAAWAGAETPAPFLRATAS